MRILREPAQESNRALPVVYNTLAQALQFAAMGFPCFPVHPTEKRPLVSAWRTTASTDPAQLEEWFRRADWQRTGLAIAPQRHVILDVDRKRGIDGAEHLKALSDSHGGLPATLSWLTLRRLPYRPEPSCGR